MRTITHSIIIVQIIASAARIPAPSLPYSPRNVRNKHDELSRMNTRDSQTTPSHSWEGGRGNGQPSVPEGTAPIQDHLQYANCVPQLEGYGPRPDDDTPDAFRHFKYFHDASNSASIPPGYKLAAGDRDLDGAVENLNYLGPGLLGTHLLKHYDAGECASLCNDLPTCASFNLYFERDPAYAPDTTAGCPDPPSTTNINCVLWHHRLEADAAINFGETREGFQVVITGSNLYNKIKGPLDLSSLGFSGPRVDVDNNAAFQVPDEPTGNYSTLLAQNYYSYYDANATLKKYDPTVCAHLCSTITNAAAPTSPITTNKAYPVCNMFVAYEMRYNDPLAMVCELYSSVWSSRYQTLREVVAFTGSDEGERTVTLHPTKISVYERKDYQYPPICAMEYQCGEDFYPGGDCSG